MDEQNQVPPEQTQWEEGPEEDVENDDFDDDEDDSDIDAEALEMARRLGEELWADISKVTAERNALASTSEPMQTSAQLGSEPTLGAPVAPAPAYTHRKEEAILATMKTILGLVENDPPAKNILSSTVLPDGQNVLWVLQSCCNSASIPKGVAGQLSQLLVALARSDALFGNLKHSNASAIQLDKGKRKREEQDEGRNMHAPAYKRMYVPDTDLYAQMNDAVRVVGQTFSASPIQALDPGLVASIRLQLHQIFLFAVTSAPSAGVNMHGLQEIAGLIQVIGVLSGIQIGQAPQVVHQSSAYPWNQGHPQPVPDIGTAVYPCLVAGCHKIFSRLYSLRAHQRVHSSHRPHRCNACPASFARNHDLKRHLRLHDNKAWRCEGCHKVFSRRDAIKRHKTGTKNRGPRSEICLVAEVVEVQIEENDNEDSLREERRVKMWHGIANNDVLASGHAKLPRDPTVMDEGEINPNVIVSIQSAILGLHVVLQSIVGAALGTPIPLTMPPTVDPSAGQATLASVIARAQTQKTTPAKAAVLDSPMQPMDAPSDPDTIMGGTLEPQEILSAPQTIGESPENSQNPPSLSMYGLSDEQAQLLEIAIANAASAAQAQAEAEAALEEEEEDFDQDDEESDDSEIE
ncbi:hypothetical protein CVT24_004563 [Panaeolus cyanescens]|uniref:C2H2-type domain-containing protein n=1 Tax=Panaeolus cyanescens TaxID=181874 RepID=A0A409VEK6_9AGAR|nr:hypothetical protein CVT24_004563 [Panaeolus cyanescens]